MKVEVYSISNERKKGLINACSLVFAKMKSLFLLWFPDFSYGFSLLKETEIPDNPKQYKDLSKWTYIH